MRTSTTDVKGKTLLHPRPLRVKCETVMQRDDLNTVRVERERRPSAQLRKALAALKGNVDTRVRVSPSSA